MLLSDKLEQFCDRRIRRSFLPVTSSRKWQSFEERLRFRNQFPQWTHPAFNPRLPHWGKKRIRLRPVPGQSAKSDRKVACFPVTLSQPISTIYYLAFVYKRDGLSWRRVPVSSLFGETLIPGLLLDQNFISIYRFLLPGMISSHGFHPDLLVSSRRDDSQPEISSLFAGFFSQRWFPVIDFIPTCWFLLAGMISGRGFHPDLLVSSPRDNSQP